MAKTTVWGPTPFVFETANGETLKIWVSGRNRYALESLIMAGESGCTPLDNPAPRWSAYVLNLRNEGLDIETIHEPHGGPFSGTHGRYVLRSKVLKGANE